MVYFVVYHSAYSCGMWTHIFSFFPYLFSVFRKSKYQNVTFGSLQYVKLHLIILILRTEVFRVLLEELSFIGTG